MTSSKTKPICEVNPSIAGPVLALCGRGGFVVEVEPFWCVLLVNSWTAAVPSLWLVLAWMRQHFPAWLLIPPLSMYQSSNILIEGEVQCFCKRDTFATAPGSTRNRLQTWQKCDQSSDFQGYCLFVKFDSPSCGAEPSPGPHRLLALGIPEMLISPGGFSAACGFSVC